MDKFRVFFFRALRFGIVGVITAACYFLCMYTMVDLLGISVMLSTTLTYVVVAIGNYLSHHKWTFKSAESHSTAFPKFILSGVIGFSLNWGMMYLGVEQLHFNYLLVQAVSLISIILWNFFVGFIWIFPVRPISSSDA